MQSQLHRATIDRSTGYGLAVGWEARQRLRLVETVYGPFCADVLDEVGLRQGLRVADIGCGAGALSAWVADRVGEAGSVVALDISGEQLEVARAETRPRT